MSLLWNVRLQERQKRVRLGEFGLGVTAFDGAYERSGDRFGLIVLRQFRGKVDGEEGSLGSSGSRELFYSTDVVIGCLKTVKKEVSG